MSNPRPFLASLLAQAGPHRPGLSRALASALASDASRHPHGGSMLHVPESRNVEDRRNVDYGKHMSLLFRRAEPLPMGQNTSEDSGLDPLWDAIAEARYKAELRRRH